MNLMRLSRARGPVGVAKSLAASLSGAMQQLIHGHPQPDPVCATVTDGRPFRKYDFFTESADRAASLSQG